MSHLSAQEAAFNLSAGRAWELAQGLPSTVQLSEEERLEAALAIAARNPRYAAALAEYLAATS